MRLRKMSKNFCPSLYMVVLKYHFVSESKYICELVENRCKSISSAMELKWLLEIVVIPNSNHTLT